MYGYSHIIFSHALYTPYRPSLSKLVLLSSAVHQAVFSCRSSLPFAIGQVQDAGLIFLSAIATAIANQGLADDWDADATVATALVTIALATASLGLALVVIGKLRLASLVSYLPSPVVGGYLGYIGYFCLIAGVNLCTGLVFTGQLAADLPTYATFFAAPGGAYLLKCVPALGGGLLLLVVAQKFTHVAALPVCICAMPAVFFAALLCGGWSLDDARAGGWIDPPVASSASFGPGGNSSAAAPSSDAASVVRLFRFSSVHWDVLPSQIPTWLGMVFVVSFSSCLDVAAIEMDLGETLRINHELVTVGVSNVVSGLLGGFTGSYIFSQTIFTSRTGIQSRVIGLVVIASELGLFLAPVSMVSERRRQGSLPASLWLFPL